MRAVADAQEVSNTDLGTPGTLYHHVSYSIKCFLGSTDHRQRLSAALIQFERSLKRDFNPFRGADGAARGSIR